MTGKQGVDEGHHHLGSLLMVVVAKFLIAQVSVGVH